MNNGKLLTIKEASSISGLAISTLYKAVQKGILPVEYGVVQGKQIKKVKKQDITRIFGISDSTVQHGTTPDIVPDITRYNTVEYDRISDIVQENIKKVIEEKQTQLMKPLEDQALYLAGKYESENKFLKEKLETVLQENEELRTGLKSLPGPAEEVKVQLVELEKENKELIETVLKQKEHFQKEEKDYFATIEELKKQLEEEQNKPWWKKLW